MIPRHSEDPISQSVSALGHGIPLLFLFPGKFGILWRHGLALALALANALALALLRWARI
eukprot:9841271-Lingulodinium_polyedra.AAC.1